MGASSKRTRASDFSSFLSSWYFSLWRKAHSKKGCYALQTLGHVPVIFIWNRFLMDDAIEWITFGCEAAWAAVLLFVSQWVLPWCLDSWFHFDLCLSFSDRRWPLPVWEWLNCAPTHRVAYAFGDKHHQKRWLFITGILCGYLKSFLIRRSTSTSILPLMCLTIESIASGSTEW